MTSPIRPYLAEHENPQGEGDARPTAMKIIFDDDLVNRLTGKVFLVTGTSSGIGVETVRALHATGADVFMHVRDMVKGESARKDILASSEGKGKLELLYMDLGSFKSIRAGAAEFLEKSNKLNVLVNNAGKHIPKSPTFYQCNILTYILQASATLQRALQKMVSKFNSVQTISATSSCSSSSSLPFWHPVRHPSIPAW